MSEREELLKSLSETIKDYRVGETSEPTPDHVARWVDQFDASVQLPILKEMDHVLTQTYLSKKSVQEFLSAVAVNEKLTGQCFPWIDQRRDTGKHGAGKS